MENYQWYIIIKLSYIFSLSIPLEEACRTLGVLVHSENFLIFAMEIKQSQKNRFPFTAYSSQRTKV